MTNDLLYIADSNYVISGGYYNNYSSRIRVVDLTTGVIDTWAGGGNAPGPGYGDGGPAATASVGLTNAQLTLGPDGALYFPDYDANRVRRIDPVTNTITTWLNSGSCTGKVALRNNGRVSGMAWDAAGNAFIFGDICDGVTSSSDGYGVIRRGKSGELGFVAGRTSGSSAESIFAPLAALPSSAHLTFDAGGNLYLLDTEMHRVRIMITGRRQDSHCLWLRERRLRWRVLNCVAGGL